MTLAGQSEPFTDLENTDGRSKPPWGGLSGCTPRACLTQLLGANCSGRARARAAGKTRKGRQSNLPADQPSTAGQPLPEKRPPRVPVPRPAGRRVVSCVWNRNTFADHQAQRWTGTQGTVSCYGSHGFQERSEQV